MEEDSTHGISFQAVGMPYHDGVFIGAYQRILQCSTIQAAPARFYLSLTSLELNIGSPGPFLLVSY
jgi:hypothetical protein